MWRQANKYRVPRMCFVNKMDRVGADFDRTVAMIRDRLEATPAVVQIPIGAEGSFEGVIDLLKMKALVWGEGMGETWETREIPAHLAGAAEDARHALIDVVSNFDDNVMERYVSERGDHPRRSPQGNPRGDHREPGRPGAVRLGLQEQGCPAHARRRRRLPAEPARRAARRWASSPGPATRSSGTPDDDEPFSSLAFKIMSDPFVGKLTYLRVYSGTLEKGTTVLNTSRDRKERIGRILQMHANHREDRDAVYTGDIVAVVGLKSTTTGDTLCDMAHPIVLESLSSPSP